VALYRGLAKDPRTPTISKWLLVVAVGYALSPVDLIPEAIPVLGLLDDMLIVGGLIWLALRLIPKSLIEEHRRHAGEGPGDATGKDAAH